MGYIYIFAIVIILFIATFLIIIFFPKPRCYFDPYDTCKELLILSEEKQFEKIKKEIVEFEQQHTSSKSHVTTIKLYHNDIMHDDIKDIPNTYELLRTIPNLHAVYIKIIPPRVKTPKCKGSQITNKTLECILPVKISAARKSSIWNDGETKFFVEDNIIIHDASREHMLVNKHKKNNTVILVLIIDRPSWILGGIA